MSNVRKIVLIMTDTQRWDMVGCYGNPDMKTPALDGLAQQGVRFDRAYCCQPVCTPARAAIFTGTFPHSNGAWANCMPFGDNVKTIGQRLHDEGFRTAYIGKWHLDGGDYFGVGRCPDGWDEKYWYDMRSYLEELSPEDRVQSRSAKLNEDPNLTAEFTFGHRCSSRAIDFLKDHCDDDFLLVVSYDEPHGPSVCPKPFSEMYKDYEFPKRENVRDTLENKPEHQRVWAGDRLSADKDALQIKAPAYLGCNSFVDHEIGRVVDAIDQFAPDALVIYTSDHGDFLCSHSLSGKGPAMYDEITRVPLIVRWPDVVPEESVHPHPVSHVDLVPTILEAAGVEIPKLLEGQSLLGALRTPETRVDDAVFMEFSRYEVDHDGFGGFQPVRAGFDGRFKLVINLLTTDELYDVQNDPDELKNLIDVAEHTAARNALHDRILDWMNRTRDPFRGYYWERRPWRTDARSASWGYTGMTRQRENEEYEPRQLDYDTGLEMTEAVRKKQT
ncbi:MAG: sulfatase [Lentisphaerae bacterium RIFOXYB12_FULL_65_16]|nr:MAG: sulfatase [Lentisphaerae bacterium RIFOXYA12_64_32]OGV87973.1 MAG: sulfatase [Lentisphaerae bacterium RIFOXYB12_FULL_65_16]